jgi:hypothetical protein
LNPPIRYVLDYLLGLDSFFVGSKSPRSAPFKESALLLVIDDRTNLGAEFFFHAVDHRVLLGTAPATAVG